MASDSNRIRNYTNKEYKVLRLIKGTKYDDYFPKSSISYVGRHRKHKRRNTTEILLGYHTFYSEYAQETMSYPVRTWHHNRYNSHLRIWGDKRWDYRCWKRYRKHQYKE